MEAEAQLSGQEAASIRVGIDKVDSLINLVGELVITQSMLSRSVKDIEMNIVISTAKDFVLPLNIDYDNKNQISCSQECRNPVE